jgi:hypothetical protein
MSNPGYYDPNDPKILKKYNKLMELNNTIYQLSEEHKKARAEEQKKASGEEEKKASGDSAYQIGRKVDKLLKERSILRLKIPIGYTPPAPKPPAPVTVPVAEPVKEPVTDTDEGTCEFCNKTYKNLNLHITKKHNVAKCIGCKHWFPLEFLVSDVDGKTRKHTKYSGFSGCIGCSAAIGYDNKDWDWDGFDKYESEGWNVKKYIAERES